MDKVDVGPADLINRRRRQLHVHSVLYYYLDTPIVSDAVFDKWANELVELHDKYPDLVKQGYMWQIFEDWTGDTGMHLPIHDRTVALAYELLRIHGKDA